MANENETVEQVHDELKRDPLAPNGAKPWTHYLAERILAAHKRELEEQAAVNEEQATQLRDALNECEELKHEIAAKDTEIARLKRENVDINGCLLAEQELVEKRESLIKELADALHLAASHTCYTSPVNVSNFRALVAKSREVVSKMETTEEVANG